MERTDHLAKLARLNREIMLCRARIEAVQKRPSGGEEFPELCVRETLLRTLQDVCDSLALLRSFARQEVRDVHSRARDRMHGAAAPSDRS